MDYLYDSYINWFEFIVLVAILIVVFYFLRKFKAKVLWLTGLHNLTIVNSVLVVFIVLAFIAINPSYHFVIICIGILIGYSVLADYVKGVVVATNSQLVIGDLIKVGDFKGKVAAINLSGIKMLNEEANLFLPYKLFSTQTIEKFKSDQASFISLTCEPKEDLKGRVAILSLEKSVFDFPFVKNDSNIEIQHDGAQFHVKLTLANDRFRASLFNQMEKAGFTITNKK